MASGFKSFGNNSIYTGLLAFFCKESAGNHMADNNTVLFKVWRPFFRRAGRCKYNLYLFLYQNFHEQFHFGI